MRKTIVERKTAETTVKIYLNLDGKGIHKIHSGIGFLDHMLTQLAVHGLFDLEVDASGDTQVDSHHTVEDVALTLGQAFDQAIKDKRGLVRMGQAVVPMDETLCEVIVDLSGRPYFVFKGDWNLVSVGNLPVSLIEHFFYSLSMSMKANLHTHIRYGRDDHHKAEGLFKALGRALNGATRIEARRSADIPSSKGVL